ncbi:MAG: response regulator transcription factor [Micromonosporaceae bacterium]|nr:response regulator transcription factor [Micromonosporaceae bacterium]
MERVRTLLVDDHPVFAQALAVRLSGEPGITVVPVAHTVDQAVAELARSRPEVALVDLVLGRQSGLTVVEHIRTNHPETKVIMLTGVNDLDTVVEAVRRGARAWLPKSADVAHMIRVIRGVLCGEAWIPPLLLQGVLTRLAAPEPVDPLGALTAREREVLQCVVDGLPRQEIARRLYLSPNTVRTHVQKVLTKLDSHSILEAVALARRAGMRPSGA